MTPLPWIYRDDPLWPYEAHHGGLVWYTRSIGGGYCLEVELGNLGIYKFRGPASLRRLRKMSRRDAYAALRRYLRFVGHDFEAVRP